ncbi:23S rRNA (uracil(747)-C(5))-methyltransferase RlmC [Pseudarthrobacter sp. J75]|uniref:23S rRNA (uracil(747)-C(5))-methyltransferase RlmC n=1 Tax=unclassified Pseudarthrobacter TaxID=2647000 RepID=UPI002E82160A|nr:MULTISPECIES: 23S rRNA (uracil(747)-C(5))-methyltransferase RlmC [unclassified Pseudarthrobacter]MEE2523568.1 23S rRNA (uracil(747)-C(5))-methyltransferase RlmC [Pseudarthrobacter sp. J47]MEE2530550.1 23S rRNA (uracil(747)-C(5))-methyltransferase RlmC [Pseudarthrobacter sp. J75]
MDCVYFDAGRCRSCSLMGTPYPSQLAEKEADCQTLLAAHRGIHWLPSIRSDESGFRNKAKMVIGGTAAQPTIGILDAAGEGVDLSGCNVCSPGLLAAFPAISAFISRAGLTPYSVPRRSGELKNIILTESPDGELMLRLVMRSDQLLARIRKNLPGLLADLPELRVVSVNLHPEHKAVLEGEDEVVLTAESTLPMRVNDVTLHLRPQSFFQTNTDIAAALYRQGRDWVDRVNPSSVWDLYCGVGGFALHSASPGRDVTGIEFSAEAINSARLSAREAGLDRVRFEAGDATAFVLGSGGIPEAASGTEASGTGTSDGGPDLMIVNPPRRGIGSELCNWLEASDVQHLLYSSCNAKSLAKDLAAMPSFTAVEGRLLDMFPQTRHYEVMVLLERRAA